MLYHRLLSNALSSRKRAIPSSEPLDFDALWQKAEVDPACMFSPSLLRRPHSTQIHVDAEKAYNSRCLNDLVKVWHSTVDTANIVGVDKTLTLLYRQQSRMRAHASNKDLKWNTSLTKIPVSIDDKDVINSESAKHSKSNA